MRHFMVSGSVTAALAKLAAAALAIQNLGGRTRNFPNGDLQQAKSFNPCPVRSKLSQCP